MQEKSKHIKSFWRKKIMVFLSVCFLALGISIPVVAYMVVGTNNDQTITYTTTGAAITCQLDTTGFTNGANSVITVKNTGDVSAYIRVEMTPTFEDGNGKITSVSPKTSDDINADYYLDININSWIKGADGYYYCKSAIEPGAITPILVNSYYQKQEMPYGLSLCWTVLADAVQAIPNDNAVPLGQAPAEQAWGITVNRSNGQIVK